MRCQLVSWKNGKIVKKFHDISQSRWYRDKIVECEMCLVEKHYTGTAKHWRYNVYSRSSLYWTISRACLSRISAVFFISSTIWSFGASFQHLYSRIFHTPPSFHLSIFLSFSLFLFHVRYVRNLVVANSCMNVNAGRGRLYELFQFTSVNGESFHSFFLSSFSCLPFSFFSPHRIRSHEPYHGNSTFVFVFRRRRWLD